MQGFQIGGFTTQDMADGLRFAGQVMRGEYVTREKNRLRCLIPRIKRGGTDPVFLAIRAA